MNSAGVPAVVASQWAIEDEETSAFFVAFHERVARGERPASALRATQVERIGGSGAREPSAWAAFQIFGR